MRPLSVSPRGTPRTLLRKNVSRDVREACATFLQTVRQRASFLTNQAPVRSDIGRGRGGGGLYVYMSSGGGAYTSICPRGGGLIRLYVLGGGGAYTSICPRGGLYVYMSSGGLYVYMSSRGGLIRLYVLGGGGVLYVYIVQVL